MFDPDNVSSVGRTLHRYRRGPGFKSTTSSVVFITARIDSIFVSSTAVHVYDFQIFTGIDIQYCLRMYIKLNWYFFSSNISDQQSHYATPNSCQLS